MGKRKKLFFTFFVVLSCISTPAFAQLGTVLDYQKISETQGNFTGNLGYDYQFGSSVCSLGDLDGDGINDVAVGVQFDDDGGTNTGAVWILFLNPDGTVKTHQKISDTQGGFGGNLNYWDYFGQSVTTLGDLDGDGVTDIAVGAGGDNNGGSGGDPKVGAVWILFLNSDGTVKDYQKISDTHGGFTGTLGDNDYFGFSVDSIGDLDGDGVTDLAVGARWDNDGGTKTGTVWILFLNPDGTVKSHQKISATQGGFTGTLSSGDTFGVSITSLGDFDNDGLADIVVGARTDDDGGSNKGAVWMLFLNSDGTVKSHQKISETKGNFTGSLENGDCFGSSVESLGDIDFDGVTDIAVGAWFDDDGGNDQGAVWILFLNPDGTVKAHQKISSTEGNFTGILDDGDRFGRSIANLGDLNGDGSKDIVVGACRDDDGNTDAGAVWVLFLDTDLYTVAIKNLADAMEEKQQALDKIQSAMEKELAAIKALDELRHSGDLGDLNMPDIIKAKVKVHVAMVWQRICSQHLHKSIGKLESALEDLGCEVEPANEPNLIAHWKFDETKGNIAYDSIGDNDGTVYGAQWTEGQVNGALEFDGQNDYVAVADNPALDGMSALTLSAWVKTAGGHVMNKLINFTDTTNDDSYKLTVGENNVVLCHG